MRGLAHGSIKIRISVLSTPVLDISLYIGSEEKVRAVLPELFRIQILEMSASKYTFRAANYLCSLGKSDNFFHLFYYFLDYPMLGC